MISIEGRSKQICKVFYHYKPRKSEFWRFLKQCNEFNVFQFLIISLECKRSHGLHLIIYDEVKKIFFIYEIFT